MPPPYFCPHFCHHSPHKTPTPQPLHSNTMGKSVVIVNTSAGAMGGNPTGLWLSELADPYYALKEAGLDVTIASIAGGAIPIDPGSMGENFFEKASSCSTRRPSARSRTPSRSRLHGGHVRLRLLGWWSWMLR